MGVKNKVCIITGSGQGLGKAFAKVLLDNGAKVCISDLNEEKCQTVPPKYVYGGFQHCSIKLCRPGQDFA